MYTPKCTCDINGAETDIGHFKDCPAMQQESKPTDWEERLVSLVDDYAAASYLVDEENHPEHEAISALKAVKSFVDDLLSRQKSDLIEKVKAMNDKANAIYRQALDDVLTTLQEQ